MQIDVMRALQDDLREFLNDEKNYAVSSGTGDSGVPRGGGNLDGDWSVNSGVREVKQCDLRSEKLSSSANHEETGRSSWIGKKEI